MFISSTRPLPNGEYKAIVKTWGDALALGLNRQDYGYRWFAYDSEQDYIDSLD